MKKKKKKKKERKRKMIMTMKMFYDMPDLRFHISHRNQVAANNDHIRKVYLHQYHVIITTMTTAM